ncbi:MAG: tRNA-dihydrouridine synthase family protein [Candidatus Paceibacterota bacterium]
MSEDFWKNLKRPILAVAPMSDVTDEPFREMFLKYGRPDVFWTEFISDQELFSRGKDHCLKETLRFAQGEHPIVAQVFGNNPSYFAKTAQLLKELGFDGIDLNMGCPNKDIEKKGGGAALMKNPGLAREIIRAIKETVPEFPISVKTRIGYGKNEIEEWLPNILEEGVAALTVHLRTRQELFHPPAHWELAGEVLKLRAKYCPETLILGNGDVKSMAELEKLAQETGLDGIMVGRGAIGNPWFFSGYEPCPQERLKAMLEHVELFCNFYPRPAGTRVYYRNFERIKKHLHAYCKGFVGAKELRDSLMKARGPEETKGLVEAFLRR